MTATGDGEDGAEPTAALGVRDAVIARTACAARSDSRRLRSSETLSVAVCLDTGFLAAVGAGAGRGKAMTLAGASGSLI